MKFKFWETKPKTLVDKEVAALKSVGYEGSFEAHEELDGFCVELEKYIRDTSAMYLREAPMMEEELLADVDAVRSRRLQLEAEQGDALLVYLQPYFALAENLGAEADPSNFTDIGWTRYQVALNWGKHIPENWRDVYQAGSQRKG